MSNGCATDEHKEEVLKKESRNIPEKISGEISSLLERYPDQDLINKAFEAIASTRKTKRIANSRRLSILQAWERCQVQQVKEGICKYLNRNYASEGKREAYLLAIIRNQKIGEDPKEVSTGSPVLDHYYAQQRLGS